MQVIISTGAWDNRFNKQKQKLRLGSCLCLILIYKRCSSFPLQTKVGSIRFNCRRLVFTPTFFVQQISVSIKNKSITHENNSQRRSEACDELLTPRTIWTIQRAACATLCRRSPQNILHSTHLFSLESFVKLATSTLDRAHKYYDSV